MKFRLEQYVQALYDTFQETKPKDYDRVIANFVEILKSNGDLEHYERIIASYEEFDRKQKGITEIEVTTAREAQVNEKLIRELNEVAGNDVTIKRKVDENLIGGVVIKVEDTLIDGSIKTNLQNLHKRLSN
jgi:F-type H+-transporting ATPase subunit delta